MTGQWNERSFASVLAEQAAQLAALLEVDAADSDSLGMATVRAAERRMQGMADGYLRGITPALANAVGGTGSGGRGGESPGVGNTITQHIYLKDNDPSPYQTARAIRRESEAILRL